MDLRALLGYRRMKQEADQLLRRGAAIFQLQYDDLVREPETALSAICEFIGVPFDPKMTSLEGADRSAVYKGEHHSMVKSSNIVANRERPEVLSPELKSKIERYVVYWRKQSCGKWPVNAAVREGTTPAAWFERTVDRVRHRTLRTSDLMVPFAYSLVPVSLWQKYRQMKSKYQRVAPEVAESKAIS
jgi:hypothetical protein